MKDYNLGKIKGFSRICDLAIEEIRNHISDLFNITYITHSNIKRYIELIERLQDSNFSENDINNCIAYIRSITDFDIFNLDVSNTIVYKDRLYVIASFYIYDKESDENYKVNVYITYIEFAKFDSASVYGPYYNAQLSKEEYTNGLVRNYFRNIKESIIGSFKLVDSDKIVEE